MPLRQRHKITYGQCIMRFQEYEEMFVVDIDISAELDEELPVVCIKIAEVWVTENECMEGCKSAILKHSTTAPGLYERIGMDDGYFLPEWFEGASVQTFKVSCVYCRKPITIVEGIKVTMQSHRGCFQHMGCIDAYLRELALS
jgi:hypothetical protein